MKASFKTHKCKGGASAKMRLNKAVFAAQCKDGIKK
jgi:hypothetical protein